MMLGERFEGWCFCVWFLVRGSPGEGGNFELFLTSWFEGLRY